MNKLLASYSLSLSVILTACIWHAHTQHPDIDVKNDWKLLTLFVGANDICLGCVSIAINYICVYSNTITPDHSINRAMSCVILGVLETSLD